MTNIFKERLSKGEKLLGGWLISGNSHIAEAIAQSHYDFIVIDMEHSKTNINDIHILLNIFEPSPVVPVIRIADHDMMNIRKIADLGAKNIIVPFVENAQEMAEIIAHAFYPPAGRRGYAGTIRAARYGADKNYARSINDEMMVIPQIETPNALKNLRDIAKIPNVRGLFFGPGDYSCNIGQMGQAFGDDTKRAMWECAKIAQELGLPIGSVSNKPEIAHEQFGHGYGFTSLKNDISMVINGIRQDVDDVKKLMGQTIQKTSNLDY